MECLFGSVVLGVIAFAMAMAQNQRGKARIAWETAARSLHLVCNPGGTFDHPSIRGALNGHRVSVDVVTRGGGKNRKTFTRYRVHYPSLDLGLRLTREVPVFSTLAKTFGGQDIEIGDSGFDDDVLVKGKSERKVRAFLAGPRRAAVHRFLNGHRSAEITDDHASFETRDVESNAILIQRNLTGLAKLALQLHEPGGATTEPPRAPRVESGTKSDALAGAAAAISAIAASASTRAPDLETKDERRRRREREQDERERAERAQLAVDFEAIAEEHRASEAETLVAEAADWLTGATSEPSGSDGDEVTSDDAATGAEVDQGDPIAEERPTGSAAPTAQSLAPDIAEPEQKEPSLQTRICTALFGEDLRIPDIESLFGASYDGSDVRWSGRLKNVRHYYTDSHFGTEPGTRAELVVASVSAGMFGARDVVAVVQLPEDAEADLRMRTGETFSFTGRLTGLDAFMREVYVADGELHD